MLYEIDIFPAGGQLDVHALSVGHDAADFGFTKPFEVKTAYGYLIETQGTAGCVAGLAAKLLADPIVERYEIVNVSEKAGNTVSSLNNVIYVLPKSGVTDSVADNAKKIMADFGIQADSVKTFKKYWFTGLTENGINTFAAKLLANDAVEQVLKEPLVSTGGHRVDTPRSFINTIAIRSMSDTDLQTLSKQGQLYLSLTEMQTIQKAFQDLQRDPTDIELETLAQTWSEHCSHKTLAGKIHYVKKDADGNVVYERQFDNMLKETIFAATQKLRETNEFIRDFCVSVFSDNAGVVKFDDDINVCFKVETHNHPSALEPYGGANTGLGGVIRDPMGTGMGAKPIASTDVFCFANPDIALDKIPAGVLHPRRIMKGVVSGVRDYGNRMGIPTVNGAVYFDERYLGNPLVFCGNIGILPKDKSFKEVKAGDLIVALGGRTGRDGIHGATFSSAELTHESETISGGAVQIGNAITEKMVLDVMLQARDRNLYNAVTDCGAGGFSSAVGEMGEKIGAEVELSNAPLKYEGLTYTEIWISEAQERMVFSVPPEKWDEFKMLADSEDVEAVILGKFGIVSEGDLSPRLILKYHGETVADLDMALLHNGRPPVVREAMYHERETVFPGTDKTGNTVSCSLTEKLKSLLSSLNICSKHWIIRQYDHEVQGGSVVKPLVGIDNDGPSDAAVVRPRLDSRRGLVVSCGLNPALGDSDPYAMAVSAIDEAVRNAVAVGADPKTICLLDNFCWGNCEKPETLGSLVEAALACYDVSLAYKMPFISGKDSLNNEFKTENKTIAIPPTLLISAMGQMDDVSKCVTMDVKKPGNVLCLIEGSYLPLDERLGVYQTIHKAIQRGLLCSVHDISDGGLAVAVAEMCFAGGSGADLYEDREFYDNAADVWSEESLFGERDGSFVVEIAPENVAAFGELLGYTKLGIITDNKILRFNAVSGGTSSAVIEANIDELKAAWQKPLDW
ncbi:MAG: phosphoribosylformylglycinamidine synthase [Planctomycetaceae bacterium]|jgi:phosphoribosylformylglycinamidine synthase|nr:phosphoribosylformylglycinamidine synthase [Planctomycetaceae bacterium]